MRARACHCADWRMAGRRRRSSSSFFATTTAEDDEGMVELCGGGGDSSEPENGVPGYRQATQPGPAAPSGGLDGPDALGAGHAKSPAWEKG